MHKKLHHRHFVSYTIEHLLGVFFVFTVAITVGYIASADTATSTDGASGGNGGTTMFDTIPPTQPMLHLGTVSSNMIGLYWDGSVDNVGVMGYKLFKNGVLRATLTSQSYTDSSNLTPGFMIAYYVVAVDAAGNISMPSDTTTVLVPTATTGNDAVAPAAPVLGASVNGSNVDLSWTESTPNVSGFKLYKIISGLWTDVGNVSGTSFFHTDSSLPAGTYYYKIQAFNLPSGGGTPLYSGVSNVVTVSVGAVTSTSTNNTTTTAPPAPSLSLTIQMNAVTLSFGGTGGDGTIAGYKIFKNGSFLTGVSGGVTSYADVNLSPGSTYTYYVKAVDALQHESAPSITLSATIPTSTVVSPPVTTVPPPTTTPILPSVSFGVTPAPITDCSGVHPMTEVFFVTSDPQGGVFELSSDNGIANARLNWGRYPFPNGRYTWRAVVNPGYALDGAGNGYFELRGACLSGVSTTSTTNTTASPVGTSGGTLPPPTILTGTTPVVILPQPPATVTITRPVLKIFLDNIPVTDANHVFDDEDVELRAITPSATKVNFYALVPNATTPVLLGGGEADDLLTSKNADVWTHIWNAKEAKDGQMKVFARVLLTNGTQSESMPLPLTVKHHVASAVTSSGGTDAGGSFEPTSTMLVNRITRVERDAILARVDDPAFCMNALECKVYCESHPDEHERCVAFAQVMIVQATTTATPSLADNISPERISNLLGDPARRPKDIPESIEDPADLRSYCGDLTHADICKRILMRADLATEESVETQRTALRQANADVRKIFEGRTGARTFVDSDNDGIGDYDEVNIYRTDPANRDTDHDGFPDEAEILAHTNPSGENIPVSQPASSSAVTSTPAISAPEEVRMEDPLMTGAVAADVLTVSDIVVAEAGVNDSGEAIAKKLTLSGKALPHSIVTLYIYSEPIVVSVKTDSSGAWTYTLDKELSDGSHQVVSAITDSGGRILAKSEPLPFVKVAAAVSVGPETMLPGESAAPGFFSGPSLYAFIAILIGLIGIAFSVLGFTSRLRTAAHREGDLPPPTELPPAST